MSRPAVPPRPLTVVLASWLTMVWSAFTLGAVVWGFGGPVVSGGDLATDPVPEWGIALMTIALLAVLGLCAAALHLGTLLWRRSRPARWLLLAPTALVTLSSLAAGRDLALLFGLPAAVTFGCLLLPPTSRWLAAPDHSVVGRPIGARRLDVTDRRPGTVVAGCVLALGAVGLSLVTTGVQFFDLPDPSEIASTGGPDLTQRVDPVALETWLLSMLMLELGVALGIGLAAVVAFSGSATARLVTSVAAGVWSLPILAGEAIEPGSHPWSTLALAAVSLLAVLLLATPPANAWYRTRTSHDTTRATPPSLVVPSAG